MADADLLDELKEGFKLKNDAALAGFLGVTRATIHNCRFDEGRRLGRKAKFNVLDRIAYLRAQNKVGQWIGAVTNQELAEKIVGYSVRIGQRRALRDIPDDNDEIAESELIDMAKIAFKCDTDEELAEKLQVARNTISAVRKGRTSLGLDPRLRILNEIEPFEIDKFQRALDSTDELIEVIRDWAARQPDQEETSQT